ncbi:MAG: ribulose-phosphate 3-epimerase [Actinobacteria bacterium]|nr:ribulose-phosphate 3-epimerase [Actinomycetota bacterium]NCX64225.1 ribulose-phosphate 3-epimerase [Actinomycetota bacterium]
MHIHPSLLAADFGNIESELASIASADAAHLDVMDNHFVPNLTFGVPLVQRMIELSPIPTDIHLMIENVDTEAVKYAELGPHSVTFHIEASKDPVSTCRKLRQMGVRSAVAIKPNTPVSSLSGLLEEIDMLLVMTVEPGFGGQKLITETMPKVAEARALISGSKFEIALQVDGGVTLENIGELAALGADTFVAGSSVFGSADHAQRILELRKSAASGLNQ